MFSCYITHIVKDYNTTPLRVQSDVPSSHESQWSSAFLDWIHTLWWSRACRPLCSTCHHLGCPQCAGKTWTRCQCSLWSIQLWSAEAWRWLCCLLFQQTQTDSVQWAVIMTEIQGTILSHDYCRYEAMGVNVIRLKWNLQRLCCFSQLKWETASLSSGHKAWQCRPLLSHPTFY